MTASFPTSSMAPKRESMAKWSSGGILFLRTGGRQGPEEPWADCYSHTDPRIMLRSIRSTPQVGGVRDHSGETLMMRTTQNSPGAISLGGFCAVMTEKQDMCNLANFDE